jgi:hypothetical protein
MPRKKGHPRFSNRLKAELLTSGESVMRRLPPPLVAACFHRHRVVRCLFDVNRKEVYPSFRFDLDRNLIPAL